MASRLKALWTQKAQDHTLSGEEASDGYVQHIRGCSLSLRHCGPQPRLSGRAPAGDSGQWHLRSKVPARLRVRLAGGDERGPGSPNRV